MGVALKVNDLYKSYGDNHVLKGVSFEVERGEVFSLLGINGAGKSTTFECIEGIRKYDSGTIWVNGRMGVQLQSSSLMPEWKVKEAIRLFQLWRGSESVIGFETLGIDAIGNKMYKSLSGGQQKRLHLAIALIGDPDIVFLDEPTAGLDVEGQIQIHEIARQLKSAGKAVVLASHDMAEVEELSDRLAILRDGKIAFVGSPAELKNSKVGYGDDKSILIRVLSDTDISKHSFEKCTFTQSDQGYSVFKTINIADALYEILTYAREHDISIRDIQTKHTSLEQRFIEVSKEVKS